MTIISSDWVRAFPLITCLVAFLSSCTQTPVSPADATSASNAWPTYENPATQTFIDQCRDVYSAVQRQISAVEKKAFRRDKDLLDAINQLDISLNASLGLAGLYANVHPDATMREAGDVCEQKLLSLENDIFLSPRLYQQLAEVKLADLNEIDRHFANRRLQLSKLKGAHLPADKRQRMRELNDAIVKTGQEFSANMRNDKRQVILSPDDLRGLPEDYIAAHPVNAGGKVVLTTDSPDYLPFMLYAHSDSARLRMYKAARQRAYPANREVLKRLLTLRHELAELLGYDNFADYITADKMIGSARNAGDFIDRIHQVVIPRSQQDYAVLLQRLRKIDPSATQVGDWQKTYLENLIKNDVYTLNVGSGQADPWQLAPKHAV